MNLKELSARVKELNAKVNQYNKQREQEIGAKRAAEEEYRRRVEEYKAEYGVDITDANIQAEYSSVFNSVAKQVAELEATMIAVSENKFENKEDTFTIEEPSVNIEEMIAEAGKKFDEVNEEEAKTEIIDGLDNENKEKDKANDEERQAIYDTANVMDFISATSGQASKVENLNTSPDDVSDSMPINFDDVGVEESTETSSKVNEKVEDTSENKIELEESDDKEEEVIKPSGWGEEDTDTGLDLNELFNKELGQQFM